MTSEVELGGWEKGRMPVPSGNGHTSTAMKRTDTEDKKKKIQDRTDKCQKRRSRAARKSIN